jgi:hypothetical protein
MGSTKEGEYSRSIELFEDIFKNQGTYFALAFLYDSGYDKHDILMMMKLIAHNAIKEKNEKSKTNE